MIPRNLILRCSGPVALFVTAVPALAQTVAPAQPSAQPQPSAPAAPSTRAPTGNIPSASPLQGQIPAARSPAVASTTPPKAGDRIKDSTGADVGTVTSIDGANVVLKTDRYDIALPATSFTATPAGFIIAPTRAQLNATAEAAAATTAKLFVTGATVRDPAGGTVGTIQALDAEFVTLKVGKGEFRIPRDSFGGTPAGLVIPSTAEEIIASAKTTAK